jgi:hypothetical protein
MLNVQWSSADALQTTLTRNNALCLAQVVYEMSKVQLHEAEAHAQADPAVHIDRSALGSLHILLPCPDLLGLCSLSQ